MPSDQLETICEGESDQQRSVGKLFRSLLRKKVTKATEVGAYHLLYLGELLSDIDTKAIHPSLEALI